MSFVAPSYLASYNEGCGQNKQKWKIMYVNATCPPFRLSLYETFSPKGGLFMMGSQSLMTYSRLPITRTFKGNRKKVRVIGSSKKIAESKVKNSFQCYNSMFQHLWRHMVDNKKEQYSSKVWRLKKLKLWNYGICRDILKEQHPRGLIAKN